MIALLAGLTLLCIGDSITEWEQSYCDQSTYTTINIAKASTTTEWWLDPDVHINRVIPAITDGAVDVVTILLSTNDVSLLVEPLQVEANLNALIAMLEAEGVEDIVISIPPYFQEEENVPLHRRHNDALDEIASLILDIAADPSNVARFGVDWRALYLPYPNVWSGRIHPDVEAHTIAAPFVDAAIGFEPAPTIGADIDVKPSNDINSIDLKSGRVIPVVVFGSNAFDVLDIDVEVLAFGPSGALGAAPQHDEGGHLDDMNEDGYMDLLFHFRTQETGIAFGDTSACVMGEILGGIPFEGCDAILVVRGGSGNCGLGFELSLLAPGLMWLRQRRRLH